MKKAISILTLLVAGYLASGCGLQSQIDALKADEHNDRHDISDLQKRIGALEQAMIGTRTQIQVLWQALLGSDMGLSAEIADLQASVTGLTSSQSTDEAALQAVQSQITGLNQSVSVLQGQLAAQGDAAAATGMEVNNLASTIAGLQAALSNAYAQGTVAYTQVETELGALSTASGALNSQISALQNSLNSALVQLATLNGYNDIVSIKDPCGAQGSWNEVFLHLKDGRYLASFSDSASGQNTRFSILTDGSYTTTDNSRCAFDVVNGQIVNEHNY